MTSLGSEPSGVVLVTMFGRCRGALPASLPFVAQLQVTSPQRSIRPNGRSCDRRGKLEVSRKVFSLERGDSVLAANGGGRVVARAPECFSRLKSRYWKRTRGGERMEEMGRIVVADTEYAPRHYNCGVELVVIWWWLGCGGCTQNQTEVAPSAFISRL